MIIRQQQLMQLPVVTESGEKLGTIHDIEFDVDTHSVRAYMVSRFLGRDVYSIVPKQIKSISAEKIIVEDTVTKIRSNQNQKSFQPPRLDPVAPQMIEITEKP
jgi:sporulation protein YlmC with PRC-barrel domain